MVGSNEREVFCDYLTIKRDKRGSLRISKRSKKDGNMEIWNKLAPTDAKYLEASIIWFKIFLSY